MSIDFRRIKFSGSFQLKLFYIFTLLTFLIFFLLCFLYIITESRQTRRELVQQLRLRTQYLAESTRLPMYAENLDLLRTLADQAAREPEIRAVTISAPDGRKLAEIHPSLSFKTAGLISQTIEVYSNPLVDSVESSLVGQRYHKSTLLGTVRMDRGTDDLTRSVQKMIAITVSVALIFWLAVSLCCYLVLRRITSSFNGLVKGIKCMQEGDFTSRIEIHSDDEPAWAAQAVNKLADTLQLSYHENRRLQEERLNLERKMLQTQKLESLGVMAGGIAHDFNNLLQSILGNIELATMNLGRDSKPQKYLVNAMSSGRHAAHLTSLMLVYAGKGFAAKKYLNLNELVSENVEMMRTATSSAVGIDLRLPAELPSILADEAQIQQVVMNLITNAAESIEEHPGSIRIATGIQECDQDRLAASLLDFKPEPGKFVFLEIKDSGCGMSAETLACIFDPFFTTKFTGRGLGMSAVMGIMRIHNGALLVESRPGSGTTFRALFPLSESSPAMVQETADPTLQKTALSGKPLSGVALVVDDEKSVLNICSRMVELCGLKVITACDGIDAFNRFREQADEINFVLMDLTMPNMDGITAMGKIHDIRPDARVILSSGFNKEELNERITGRAPAGFIRKPYNMYELEAEIRRVLQPEQ